MTQTPEHAAATGAIAAADSMEPLADLARRLEALDAAAVRAAETGDADQLVLTAEHLLQAHVEFARAYRTWLVRRPAGRPPFIPSARAPE